MFFKYEIQFKIKFQYIFKVENEMDAMLPELGNKNIIMFIHIN